MISHRKTEIQEGWMRQRSLQRVKRRKGVEEGEKTDGGISVSIIVIIHLGLFPACPPLQGLIALYTAAP